MRMSLAIFCCLFARARRPRQQPVWSSANPQDSRRPESSERARGAGALCAGGLACCARELHAGGRNGQAARKHFPLRENRSGERTQAAEPAHGHRHLGSDRAASSKPFGFMPFYPGPGLGGHCIPADPYYLSWKAREYDFATRFIELAGEVSTAMPYHVVEAVGAALNERKKSIKGSKSVGPGCSLQERCRLPA